MTFGSLLRELPPDHLKCPSIMRTNLMNLGKMAVLPQDQEFMMDVFMTAYLQVDSDEEMYMSFWLVKLGPKDPDPLNVGLLLRKQCVHSLSVQVALTASPRDENVHVMWSRQGLSNLVGHRGTMFST